jgi:DNA-binding MarR family transcriptional regulator
VAVVDKQSYRESAGFVVGQVCRLFRGRAHELLDEIGLYPGQHFVLCALWDREGIAQSELAEALYVQPATVTNALQRMERVGLVERRQDADDQRVSRVYLTEQGRALRESVHRVWGALEDEALAGFDDEERAQLERLLLRLRDNLLLERRA